MPIQTIHKRDGRTVAFDPTKITGAIGKAMRAVRGAATGEDLDALTRQVVVETEARFGDGTPEVEGVQDLVERALMASGYFDVARAYILYRERHRELREERRQECFTAPRPGR